MTKNLFLAICTLIQANAQEDLSFLKENNFSSRPVKLMIRIENTDFIPSLKPPAMDITILEASTSLFLEKSNLKLGYQKLEMNLHSLELTFILPMNDLRLPCVLNNIPVRSEVKLEDGVFPSQYLLTLTPTAERYKLTFNSTVTQNFWAVTKKHNRLRDNF
ncbi:hypothetical protein [Candidatus Odyssella acanthamoebae]|uniref:Uncharacterized protein n=1 Tax=Candidatus Odyssella acanthamoebae TaxID=91604 RepID=A0A077AW78_9PROT|nr:hypothetical protein [Candidatus Paracaedibacter acanthamoebae]AIK96656.1 hypothetical protein ID47_07885 [Candidatus Paracaedibacter acanthamoebae]